jgi:hypothetical protein
LGKGFKRFICFNFQWTLWNFVPGIAPTRDDVWVSWWVVGESAWNPDDARFPIGFYEAFREDFGEAFAEAFE